MSNHGGRQLDARAIGQGLGLAPVTRGKGVRLQKYRDGVLKDVKCFTLKEGLTVVDRGGRNRHFDRLKDWLGARAQAGRLPPKGFPHGETFGPKI